MALLTTRSGRSLVIGAISCNPSFKLVEASRLTTAVRRINQQPDNVHVQAVEMEPTKAVCGVQIYTLSLSVAVSANGH